MRPRRWATLALSAAAGGCALRGDVTRLERQLAVQQREAARADSTRATHLAAIARLVQGVLDSLARQQEALTRLRGDLRVELFNVQQQLVAIQELTGQSQQRLTEMRAELERRAQLAAAPPAPGGIPAPGAVPTAPAGQPTAIQPGAPGFAPPGAEPSADQLLEISLQQLRRGSPSTARLGFAEFLRRFPAHARAADAEFFSGEAWTAEQRADSAAAAYQRVVQRFPASPRAPAALYKLGLLAAAAGRGEDARRHFDRVVSGYPTSEEAALARDQLRALAPPR